MLGSTLVLRLGQRHAGVLPPSFEGVPAVECEVCFEPVLVDELANDPLGLACRRLAVRVEEDVGVAVRVAAADGHASAQPLADIVLELLPAESLGDQRRLTRPVERDGDAPVFGHAENLPQPGGRKELS